MKGIFTSLSIREKGNTIWCFYTTKDNCRVPKCIKSFSGRCGVCSFSESPIILMVPCCNGLIYRRRGGGYMVVLTFQRQRRALLDALLRPWQSNVMESVTDNCQTWISTETNVTFFEFRRFHQQIHNSMFDYLDK